jgi:hypothetical protein
MKPLRCCILTLVLSTAALARPDEGSLKSEALSPNVRASDFVVRASEVHDVGCSLIVAPTGSVDSGVWVTPACSLYNYGDFIESYSVRMEIGADYDKTAVVNNQAPGTSYYCTFPTWVPQTRGNLTASCSTELSDDQNPANDRRMAVIQVDVPDVGCISIIAPRDTVDSGVWLDPVGTVQNFGTGPAGFWTVMKIWDPIHPWIPGYLDAESVYVDSGGRADVTFATWFGLARGSNCVKCSTMYQYDCNPENDARVDSVFLRVRDAGVSALLAPVGLVDADTVVIPQATVCNYGNTTSAFPVVLRIGSFYADTQRAAGTECRVQNAEGRVRIWSAMSPTLHQGNDGVVALHRFRGQSPESRMQQGAGNSREESPACRVVPADSLILSFRPCTLRVTGTYQVKCTTMLDSDVIPTNNSLVDSVIILGLPSDVGVVRIIAPTGVLDSGASITPEVVVANYSRRLATFPVWFCFTPSGSQLTAHGSRPSAVSSLSLAAGHRPLAVGCQPFAFSDSIWVTVPARESLTCTFTTWTGLPPDTYSLTFATALPTDTNPANDSAFGSFVIQHGLGIDEDKRTVACPRCFTLQDAQPNPVAEQTQIRYALATSAFNQISVYDVQGALVRALVAARQAPGYYYVTWNCCDGLGRRVAPGVYFCRMRAGSFRVTTKLMLVP